MNHDTESTIEQVAQILQNYEGLTVADERLVGEPQPSRSRSPYRHPPARLPASERTNLAVAL